VYRAGEKPKSLSFHGKRRSVYEVDPDDDGDDGDGSDGVSDGNNDNDAVALLGRYEAQFAMVGQLRKAKASRKEMRAAVAMVRKLKRKYVTLTGRPVPAKAKGGSKQAAAATQEQASAAASGAAAAPHPLSPGFMYRAGEKPKSLSFHGKRRSVYEVDPDDDGDDGDDVGDGDGDAERAVGIGDESTFGERGLDRNRGGDGGASNHDDDISEAGSGGEVGGPDGGAAFAPSRLSRTNIVAGKRVRKAVERYVDEHLAAMFLSDVPADELDAALVHSDFTDEERSDDETDDGESSGSGKTDGGAGAGAGAGTAGAGKKRGSGAGNSGGDGGGGVGCDEDNFLAVDDYDDEGVGAIARAYSGDVGSDSDSDAEFVPPQEELEAESSDDGSADEADRTDDEGLLDASFVKAESSGGGAGGASAAGSTGSAAAAAGNAAQLLRLLPGAEAEACSLRSELEALKVRSAAAAAKAVSGCGWAGVSGGGDGGSGGGALPPFPTAAGPAPTGSGSNMAEPPIHRDGATTEEAERRGL
jgi:hypothetical protein